MRLLLMLSFVVFVQSSEFCKKTANGAANGNGNTIKFQDTIETTESDQESRITKETKMSAERQQDESEPIVDLSKVPLIATLRGESLKALLIAYDAFVAEPKISSERKNMSNYEAILHQSKKRLYVEFFPKFDKKYPLGGENSFGASVTYIIDRNDLRVLRRYFSE